MATITTVTLPDESLNDIRASSIPFGVVDSNSTATAFTATVPGVLALSDGVCVMLKNGVVTSASGFTINVNGLGAKPVYNNLAAATADTTIFNINYTMIFVYDSTRVTGGCWICYRGYDIEMSILSYGHSNWNDFITAYNTKTVVYCRASSNANPATGTQTRMAFMAYVNSGDNPTNVEFQYYRSVNSHSDAQQGDQVYVYKLDKTAGWTVTVREAYSKIAVGTGISKSYSNGTITLSANIPSAATETPVMDGTAAVGSSAKFAKEDHVHPTDTSRAALASPTFTGTPSAPTATTGTNTTQIATTAFVNATIDAAQVGAAMFQGVVNSPSTISSLTDYKKGWYWVVGTADTYAGQVCEAGDMLFCISDYSSAYSTSDFSVVQNNLDLVAITNAEIDAIAV